MDSFQALQPILGAVALALVGAASIPALAQLPTTPRRRQPRDEYEVVPALYESPDGQATQESVDSFSDRESRIAAGISLALGLGASVAAATLLTVYRNALSAPDPAPLTIFNHWADVPAWALVATQWASIPRKSQYDTRFKLASLGLVSAALILVSSAVRFGFDTVYTLNHYGDTVELAVAACWTLEMVAALFTGLAFATFPHRPDVYHDGGLVDQQHAVSLLTRFSFSWNHLVFDISKQRRLDQKDLPNMDGDTRSSVVSARYLQKDLKGPLWWRIIRAFWFPLMVQWCLTLLQAILALFPQFVLYHFLEGLETPPEKRGDQPQLWWWIVGLASALLLQIWVQSAQRWNTATRLDAPSLSLLQALVFQKALSLDEVAGSGSKKESEAKDEEEDAAKNQGEKKPKTDVRQAVVNHMKMDSNRMSSAFQYNYMFPLALFKLVFAGSYLIQLLGWQAFFAGLGSALCVVPFTHAMSKKYGAIQFNLMRYRDAKAHMLTEALHGMRQIKYSALEDLYEKKIMETRNAELGQYWRVTLWMCMLNAVVNLGPLLLSCVSLSVYTYMNGGRITASVIFSSLGLFDQVDEAICNLPLIQVYLMEAWTSCVRIEKYLSQDGRSPIASPGENIVFNDATVRWPKVEDADGAAAQTNPEEETRSILRNVTVDIPNGELTIISGKTGAGKSLLLAAILGEVKLLSGSIHVPAPPPISVIEAAEVADDEWILPTLTAFVSQTPWIESGTLKENVTFGLPFNKARYNRVLQTCALEKDIELLVDGDETEVGPKGVTLSGGQRWRVALARALYSRAGILILDDVLSAVDAHVGRTIVDEALTGELAEGRTRILATHHAEMCLPKASYLIKLRNGMLEAAETVTPDDIEVASGTAGEASTAASTSELTAVDAQPEATGDDGKPKTKRAKKETDEEERETGRVKTHVYKAYLKATISWVPWAIVVFILIIGRFIGIARTWSLKELADSFTTESLVTGYFKQQGYIQYPDVHDTAEVQRRSAGFWIAAYCLLSIAMVLHGIAHQIVFVVIGLRASSNLFQRMTYHVLRAPLRWIDRTPTGRILNRFTSDTFTVDRRLASDLGIMLVSILTLVVIMGASITASPYVIIFAVILLFAYSRIASAYISAARDVKRINSVSHSPIYDQFSSVLSGLSTVRAFHRTDFYMKRMYRLIDNGAKSTWALGLLARWMSFRMGMLGAVFVTVVAIAILLGSADASLAGFALVFALRYTGTLTRLLTNMTSIELGFNAAERVLEYAELKMEPQGGDDVPASWPSEGRIEVDNLTVGYAETLPAVLKEITFDVKAGERIGVIGRTGAGKSTLAAVLFRMLEPRQGSIHIDGIDIAKVKLGQLRKRLAIIPQDPFLFTGTLRSNLNLDGSVDDYDLQVVLRRVHLIDPQVGDPQRPSTYAPASDDDHNNTEDDLQVLEPEPVSSIPEESEVPLLADQDPAPGLAPTTIATATGGVDGTEAAAPSAEEADTAATTAAAEAEANYASAFTDLSTPISTGGANLSQGQRQLVCLARALLTRPKIVVLDEATSAVDRGTDGAIQESLRREFAAGGCSVLVIAHRLSTVADFDRLLVLREGRVAEFGTPKELLTRGMERDAANKSGGGGSSSSSSSSSNGGEAIATAGEDGVGAFWELVQRSAEKERLLEMILGKEAADVDLGTASTSQEAGAEEDDGEGTKSP